MYLVDTNVLSDLAAPVPRPDLVDWLDRHSADLYLSAITAAEVVAGIAKLRRQGSTAKADRLTDWWGAVEHLYGARILPFGLSEARKAGAFTDLARAAGQAPGFADTAIAATAAANGLTVLTRNTKHFAVFPVRVVDPFEELPG
ncbi:PIN domain-containing protein [Pleomorphomonas sp. JP5]|uniref:PIN domain-containing protein n=1 Tax=Pleomorphomonas sp. JP5 TaxID=2942998 RepID=UPI0020430126|nr:PIN domain-containing protein [Pleomorphomonas sp. JP5]MCM5557297.1 PIN domain-containing protein [Pleomorphomonas sp. JP5]